MRPKKIFVSGCFDMLHSGHIRFLEEAASHGDVYVGIGSDRTVKELKGRYPVTNEAERKYVLEALRFVKKCFINRGAGLMDFLEEFHRLAPDKFIVNEDGHTPAKAQLCRRAGVEYLVLRRAPRAHLPARSTTSLRRECRIPYRLDLAGGWLDQPFVSRHAAGPVINICLEPTIEFNERSGMASSSRHLAIELWQTEIPPGDREKLAKILFAYENPPGTKYFSGSQDAIGLVLPGLKRLDYNDDYWPEKITSVQDEKILRWLEGHLGLLALGPRRAGFDVLKGTRITPANVRSLAQSAKDCWQAILNQDLAEFGRHMRRSFEAQTRLFPRMMDKSVAAAIKQYGDQTLGYKLSGAGGGGYLVLVLERRIAGAMAMKIRRE
jgi:cytidyltransferase-like protein